MVDLHTHSHFSDGDRSPWELVRQAKACGLSGLGLTDHDTLAGGEELFQAGRAFGLPVVLGVEISCSQRDGRQLHLLGYAIPPEGRQAVEDFCRPIRQARNRAVLQSAQALAQAGIRLFPGVQGPADEAVQALLAGTLAYDPDTVCAHHHSGHEEGHTCAHGGENGCQHGSGGA